jgi:hypothetical protein
MPGQHQTSDQIDPRVETQGLAGKDGTWAGTRYGGRVW